MPVAPHDPHVLRRPVRARVVWFSLLSAFLLSLLPFSGFWLILKPDFLALLLVYWTVREPKLMSGWGAFALGILADVAESATLGVHALGYSLTYALAMRFRPRILSFYAFNQAVNIWPILLLNQAITALTAMLLQQPLPPWPWWMQSLVTAALWMVLPYLLERQPDNEPPRIA